MDIMRPPLEQQVAPAPWLVARSNVDVPALIRRTLTQQPDASVDDVVRQLGAWGVQVSGIIVSMWMPQLREQEVAERIADGQSSAVGASPAHEITSSCTCNPLPCICCEPTPAWRHQHCCSVLVSEEQTKSRDTWFASMRGGVGYANQLADAVPTNGDSQPDADAAKRISACASHDTETLSGVGVVDGLFECGSVGAVSYYS